MTLFDEIASRVFPLEPGAEDHYQPGCARCDKPAKGWSGVEDWKDELGRWIGWCSNACRNAWLAGDKSAGSQTADATPDAGMPDRPASPGSTSDKPCEVSGASAVTQESRNQESVSDE